MKLRSLIIYIIQKIGIPQGGYNSSLLSGLYLYYYERTYSNINSNIHLYRYIDDIILIDTDKSNISQFPVIYPLNLELKEKTLPNNTLHFVEVFVNYFEMKLLLV